MITIIISVCIVISVMILLMFLVLKRTVKLVNDSSKTYFINTIKEYDEIIDKKQEKLEELNKTIEEEKNKKQDENSSNENQIDNSYITLKTPSYIDEDFFENYKKVNDTFNIDKEQIINKFIKEYAKNNDNETYETLIKIKEKIKFDVIYKIIKSDDNQTYKYLNELLAPKEKKYLEEFKKIQEKFDITSFLSYINGQIDKTSPIIYIKIGNKYENYDQINKNIKTVYDEKIYTGMIIIYKGKIYDYSLDGR